MECKIKLQSPLVKVFPDEEPVMREYTRFSALQGETASFQVAYIGDKNELDIINAHVDSILSPYIHIRSIELMPSGYPCHTEVDNGYLRTTPGLFPDYLNELANGGNARPSLFATDTVDIAAADANTFAAAAVAVTDAAADAAATADGNAQSAAATGIPLVPGQWRALWIDVELPADCPHGEFAINLSLCANSGKQLCTAATVLEVIGARLPAQKLIHTEWFHSDCLADYYGVPVLSESWWGIVASFIKTAVKRGINMILTPAFTPPLDTAPGGERTTVQLVGVRADSDGYSFDFDNLERWIELCKGLGVEYFEMAHLFTQWGAKAAPKIMAHKDGRYQRIFGWDTPAVGGEYTRFLSSYLPELTNRLRSWGVAGQTFFHISDEPSFEQLADYKAAKNSIAPFLEDFQIIDALSDFEFYKSGAVRKPIPASNHIQPFLDNDVTGLWTYYCTGQHLDVSNRFFALPSARNRIIGIQLYKFHIEGFLQWGYNFYNTRNSMRHINPFAVTDGGCAFPSGDPFVVYPNENGTAGESIRLMVFHEALQDLRALELLESIAGRDFVLKLIDAGAEQPITFSDYPRTDDYILALRENVNHEIKKRLPGD